jgi:hypothetical protein
MVGVGKYKGVVGAIGFRPVFVLDHMQLCGCDPIVDDDWKRYAGMLESGEVFIPVSLRGYVVDPASGTRWSRKDDFIAKHLYGFSMGSLICCLLGGLVLSWGGHCVFGLSGGIIQCRVSFFGFRYSFCWRRGADGSVHCVQDNFLR